MAKAESENVRDILVSRAAVDGTAFALLYDIYFERIFSYCVSRVRLRQIAEDFTSATFLTAVKTIFKFQGKTRIEFANWLYAIATAKINSYLSKKQTIERLMATEGEIQQAAITPLGNALRHWPAMHNIILRLKPEEQSVITLRFFENLTIDRIAEITGLKPDGVRLRIAKALGNIGLFNTEKQFEDAVKKLDINDAPDSRHKEKLRAKVLDSFDSARRRKSLAFLYIAVAAVVLIAIGFILQYAPAGKTPLPLKKLIKPPPAAVPANLPMEQKEKSRLEIIRQFADEENIAELVKILEGNDVAARLLAAKYLAELTDTNVVDMMRPADRAAKQAESNQPVVQKIEQSPSIRTINMSQAMTIGGIVVDERLAPVENAEVKVRVNWDSNSQLSAVDINGIFETDVNGIWRCESFPQDACRAEVIVTHPDYVLQEGYRPAIIEELKNFSFVTFLEKGVTVTGRVLDWEQKPLQATVTKGAGGRENPVLCDPNGWFRFDNIAPSIEVFTVQCKGAAPQVRQVDVGPNMPPMVFNLEPAKTIRARVVDINDVPLKDVHIKVSSWHGLGSLNFEITTDANGFFRWTESPADEVLFDLYKPGYIRINNFGMTSENDYVITLPTDTDETQ
jgi:RNA polymerase sigma-70 factor (ECF subfamily)